MQNENNVYSNNFQENSRDDNSNNNEFNPGNETYSAGATVLAADSEFHRIGENC